MTDPDEKQESIDKAPAPEPMAPEDPIATLQQQLGEMKDKYLRALAEQENARKRLAKEKQEIIGYSIESTVSDFLPAIDQFEKALGFVESATGEIKNWAIGFQMILLQFKQALQNYGISAFESEGTLFDPIYHDAVETEETLDAPEGTVLQEFTKGYKSATRTIRPARVKVARSPRKAENLATEPVSATPTEN